MKVYAAVEIDGRGKMKHRGKGFVIHGKLKTVGPSSDSYQNDVVVVSGFVTAKEPVSLSVSGVEALKGWTHILPHLLSCLMTGAGSD